MRDNNNIPHPSLLLRFFLGLSLLTGRVRPDPDPIQDFCVADNRSPSPEPFLINGKPCIDPNLARPSHFATSALSKPTDTKRLGYNMSTTTTANLAGLNTLGLAMARIDIDGNGLVEPHLHPRASEVLTCLKGVLLVGFVDTAYRLFTQQLKPGESFVFPKGLLHFVYNIDSVGRAVALSGFNSQNPGKQAASLATFTSNPPIPDYVLEKAFRISKSDVERIRKNLSG